MSAKYNVGYNMRMVGYFLKILFAIVVYVWCEITILILIA